MNDDSLTGATAPRINILGPARLVGTRGEKPERAPAQCVEYCAWILNNPGRTAPEMREALAVAEGTRRTNMSRLRLWLGSTNTGDLYLPCAYNDRIELHPDVTSDWEEFALLMSVGIANNSEDELDKALGLVRGIPLSDACGKWQWAASWRSQILASIRDVALRLVDLALQRSDFDAARWAVSTAMTALERDHDLVLAGIRIEHLAGNQSDAKRLLLREARDHPADDEHRFSNEYVDLLHLVI